MYGALGKKIIQIVIIEINKNIFFLNFGYNINTDVMSHGTKAKNKFQFRNINKSLLVYSAREMESIKQ